MLDEMYAPAVAEGLRRSGHDVLAVKETPGLAGTADADLLTLASEQGRALVTENIDDFSVLHRTLLSTGGSHTGLVMVPPGRFPRERPDQRRQLIRALTRFLESPPGGLGESFVCFLQSDP